MSNKRKWPCAALTEAYWFQEGPGVRKWQFTDSGIKLLNVANIEKGGTINLEKTDRHLDSSEVTKKYSHFLIDEGDLVIASSGISFDADGLLRTRGAFIEGRHLPLCLNTSTIRFKSINNNSSLRFLRHWIDSRDFRVQISKLVTGSAQLNFGPSHLKATKIPLPPLDEQKRIAAILDAADALRAKRRQSIAQLDALIQSTFLDLFGDPVTNPMGWEKPPLLELCSAKQWPTISGSQLESSGFPVYGANGQIGYYSKYNHEHPTVLVTCRGATCGTINICPPKCYVTGNAMALDDPDPKRITLRYLEWILRIRGMNDVICGAAQPQITRTGMSPITIPLPPLPLQQKFTAIVESIEHQKTTQRAHLAELDALFASLQHRAFRGEL
jgi:type I restriction enzyme S subunit